MSSGAPERLLWFPTASEEGASAERAAMSDEELLARVQAGDDDVLGVLFDRYAHLCLGIAFRILRDRGEAEGMVQEMFLEVAQQASFVFSGTEIHRLKNTLRGRASRGGLNALYQTGGPRSLQIALKLIF